MWHARLIAYRKNVNFSSKEKLSMAVVLQEQIPSEASGVAFSMNPINGNAHQTVICTPFFFSCFNLIYFSQVVETVWGQGEGLVGGTITPHSFIVDWPKREIVSQTTVVQENKIVVKEVADSEHGFVRVEDTTDLEKKESPLTKDQVIRVADMALVIASCYHVPYDIEYARVGNTIYLLQARPITSFSVTVEGTDAGFDYAGMVSGFPLFYFSFCRRI